MEATKALHDTSLPLWGTAKRIAFRYFFIFISLETWLAINIHNINYNQPGWGWLPFFSKPLYWLDKHFYHIGYNPSTPVFLGTADTPIGWVINVTIIWVAVIGCVAWSIADRRRIITNYIIGSAPIWLIIFIGSWLTLQWPKLW